MTASIRTPRLELTPLGPKAIRALMDGDRVTAQHILGLELPREFPNKDDLVGLLPIQLRRMDESPNRLEWMVRLMVAKEGISDAVVGHCGFHGPPDVIGRAEIGYTVFALHRGRGYAKEAAAALVRWAFAQGEHEVYATISPDNASSLAVAKRVGFIEIGEQVDEVDGLELVFMIRRDAWDK